MSDDPNDTTTKPVTGERKKKKKKKGSGAPGASSRPVPVAVQAAPQAKGPPVAAIVAVGIVGAIAVGWWLMRGGNKGGFAVGKEAEVEITLVAGDRTNLACASAAEIAGRKCAFEAVDKPRAGAPKPEDATTLMPYTTVDKRQILAGGLWAEENLKTGLPAGRFTVTCKFKAEGEVEKPAVRWVPSAQWFTAETKWTTGVLSGCGKPRETPPTG